MPDYLPELPPPPAMAPLPRDHAGRPVPWFVHVADDGVPDFRVIGAGKLSDAHRFDLCWVCGRRRGRHAAFVIGPMCAVNRVSSEPPSHLDCAIYSARACPHLRTPVMRRRTTGLPEGIGEPAGVALKNNPGVALVWSSKTWKVFHLPRQPGAQAGVLWSVGDPTATRWYCQGRDATRQEVLDAIATGLPQLREVAATDGPAALAALDRQHTTALTLVPSEGVKDLALAPPGVLDEEAGAPASDVALSK